MAELTNIKQGEKKHLTFIVKDAQGQLVDLSNTTLFVGFKSKKSDAAYVFSKSDTDFVKIEAPNGEVSVLLVETDTATISGKLIGELRITFQDTTIEKSIDFFLYVEQAVTA
jgi:hypothetical protein